MPPLPAQNFTINESSAGQRLDHFLCAEIPHLSRSRIQSLIKNGDARVNEKIVKAGAKIRAGDLVSMIEPPLEPSAHAAEEIPLTVLFEDSDLIVINKPPGLVIHPAAGNREHTLVNALLHHCTELSGIGGSERPGIVHRLDKETSGCIVIAKNDLAHQDLSRQFASREVSKIYLALVRGHLKNQTGIIETMIGRHPVHRKKMAVVPQRGRNAKTEYRVVREAGDFSLIECKLHTGRTHQIRVHLKHLGHPLLGDKVYGGDPGFPRQMLHAWKLGFSHPRTAKWMEFRATIPEDFRAVAGFKEMKLNGDE